MFRSSMRQMATQRAGMTVNKRAFRQAATNAAPPPQWYELSIVGSMVIGYGALWIRVDTLHAELSLEMKEMRAELKDMQAKSSLELKEMQAKSEAQFYAQLEEIKAITEPGYYSRMVFCQNKATNSNDFAQCMNTEI